MKLILASSSPRRKQILERIGFKFEIIPPNIDESHLSVNIKPEQYCISLAKMKSMKISQDHPNALVIGADTIVSLNNIILNKPKDPINAKKMLSMLSDKTHQVHTGICINWIKKNIQHSFNEISQVTFRKLDEKEITYYIENFKPYDKAGSYGIQGWSSLFVKNIQGCYDNIVGFPISRIHEELKKLDINLLDSISESA
jgi:septum formation protein